MLGKHVEGLGNLKPDDLTEQAPRVRVVSNDGRTVRLASDTHEGGVRLDLRRAKQALAGYRVREKAAYRGAPLVPGSR